MNSEPASPPAPRSTYRHGDLRRALLDAGVELARAGGPTAVVLREATRRAGVVPNAAYRYFTGREELLDAVRRTALMQVARAMQAELAAVPSSLPPQDEARAGLRAVGRAYLRFAEREPGLFRTAFSAREDVAQASGEPMAPLDDPHPFQLLGAALDRMAEVGLLPAERRAGAEFLAWSAVHGLAMLVLEGPLRRLTEAQREQAGRRLIDMVEKGL